MRLALTVAAAMTCAAIPASAIGSGLTYRANPMIVVDRLEIGGERVLTGSMWVGMIANDAVPTPYLDRPENSVEVSAWWRYVAHTDKATGREDLVAVAARTSLNLVDCRKTPDSNWEEWPILFLTFLREKFTAKCATGEMAKELKFGKVPGPYDD